MARPTFDADELHWYAIDVARQKEYVAGRIFNRMGCMTFIPTETRFQRLNRYSKSRREVARAAFPGTIFVGFPKVPDWFRVMRIHLVNGVLSFDDRPRRIETGGKEWLAYRSGQVDGQLRVERQMVQIKGESVEKSVALVHVQGRGVLRSSISLKAKAGADRPLVIMPAGKRAAMLASLFAPPDQIPAQAKAA